MLRVGVGEEVTAVPSQERRDGLEVDTALPSPMAVAFSKTMITENTGLGPWHGKQIAKSTVQQSCCHGPNTL